MCSLINKESCPLFIGGIFNGFLRFHALSQRGNTLFGEFALKGPQRCIHFLFIWVAACYPVLLLAVVVSLVSTNSNALKAGSSQSAELV